MSCFICPTCGAKLVKQDKSYVCEDRHNFDISKSGYVNLLMSQQKKDRAHGDNKLMVRARKDFLDKGYYNVLLQTLSKVVKRHIKSGNVVLDLGCGECYYTANIFEDLKEQQIEPIMMGIDISIPAVDAGAKRNKGLQLAVASSFNIPVETNSCDLALSLFAPFSKEELRRILKEQGTMVRVFPLEKHLWSLKKVLYDLPYLNEVADYEMAGFEIIDAIEVKETIHLLSHEDIFNLFSMTPYYYKSGQKNQKKLESLTQLDTEIEFGVVVYRKS